MTQVLNPQCPKCFRPLKVRDSIRYCENGCDLVTAAPPEYGHAPDSDERRYLSDDWVCDHGVTNCEVCWK